MEFLSSVTDCNELFARLSELNIKERKNTIFTIIEECPPIPYEYYSVLLSNLKEPSDTFNCWTILSKILKHNNTEALGAFCNTFKPLNRDRVHDIISKLKPNDACKSILLA